MAEHQEMIEFLMAIPWRRYCGASLSYVAINLSQGRHCLLGRLTLASQKLPRGLRFARSLDAVDIASGWINLDQARRAVAGLENGIAEVPGGELFLASPFKPEFQSGVYAFIPLDRNRAHWPERVLRISGFLIGDLVEQRRWDQLALRLPSGRGPRFRSWEDVGQRIHWAMGLQRLQNCVFDVEVPTYARLQGAEIDHATNLLSAGVESLVDPQSEKLEIVCFPTGDRFRPVTVPARRWRRGRGAVWSAQAAMPRGAGMIEIILLARGERIDRAAVQSASSTYFLHSKLDPDGSYIARLLGLSQRRPEADAFEVGVVNLFGLAGFPVVYYGHGGNHPFPDAVVQIEANDYLVVECTTRVPDPAKLEKLNDRISTLRSTMAATFPAARVGGALFWPGPGRDIDMSMLRRAGRLHVRLVSGDRLVKLLQLTTSRDQRGFRRELLRSVPMFR